MDTVIKEKLVEKWTRKYIHVHVLERFSYEEIPSYELWYFSVRDQATGGFALKKILPFYLLLLFKVVVEYYKTECNKQFNMQNYRYIRSRAITSPMANTSFNNKKL